MASGGFTGQAQCTTYSPDGLPARPCDGAAAPGGVILGAEPASADEEADLVVTTIYRTHYCLLVRQAAWLVGDLATAQDVVQDSFVAMRAAWHRLRNRDSAVAYVRQAVVNRSRSVLRHRVVVQRYLPKPAPDMPSAEESALTQLEQLAVVAALRTLSPRQREALVLKYYLDLPELEIASAMGISAGAVKQHTFRAMASLRAALSPKPLGM